MSVRPHRPFRALGLALFAALALATLASPRGLRAASKWTEVKSPHFTVVSDVSEKTARGVAWQFEQIRAVLVRYWPWAKVETSKPFLIFAVENEKSMKQLAPQYWEQKGGMRPSSLFHTGVDRHFIALRIDDQPNQRDVNPYRNAYWSYVGVVVNETFGRHLPIWLMRGLAEVMSNTIVRSADVTVGQPIPWHIERLRGSQRLSLQEIITADRTSPHVTNEVRAQIYDSNAYALVHYLIMGEQGANLQKFNRAASAVLRGGDATQAFADAFGGLPVIADGFGRYSSQFLFVYHKVALDVEVNADAFSARPMTPAEWSAATASLLATEGRETEARAAIAAARTTMPALAAAFEIEGWLEDRAGRPDAARSAYEKACAGGAASYYAEYRYAALSWPAEDVPSAERKATLERMVTGLQRSSTLNPAFTPARTLLADALVDLGRPDEAWPHALAAVKLEPRSAWTHLVAARTLTRMGRPGEGLQEAETALRLATTPEERDRAQRVVEALKNAPGGPR